MIAQTSRYTIDRTDQNVGDRYVALACGIYYSSATSEAIDKSINIRYEERDMVKAAQVAVLEESAHWIEEHNPSTGESVNRLVIPIDDAMNIVAGNAE